MAHVSSTFSANRPLRSACFLILLLVGGVQYGREKRGAEWIAELNLLEIQANDARTAYWAGEHAEALRQFAVLTTSVHPSVILYLKESAMASLAQGQYAEAERYLRRADSLLNTYYSEEREKRALSAFGAEAEKVYRGDPYEQATMYMLLALILLDRGDYDNALAACKSGILADSDASENLFDSDIALLHALEAKCYHLRGEEEAFRARREAAAKSVRITSLEVRDKLSMRQDQLALLRMSQAERRRLGDKRTDQQIKAEMQRISDELDRLVEKIDAVKQLGPLYSAEFNTLVIVPRGRSVHKTRAGGEAEMVVFTEHPIQCQAPDLYLNEQPLAGNVSAAAFDVDFQATTRGGRRMDAILKGQAVSRATTREVGQAFLDAGSSAGGAVGLGIVLVGGMIQATAGAMSAEADTRCWQTLPTRFDVYALKLPAGRHELTGSHYVYFRKSSDFLRTFVPEKEQGMAVVFVPPPIYGSYCSHAEVRLTHRDRETTGADILLVVPPTDLDSIIRVDVVSPREKPEAIATDPRRVMRSIREVLNAAGVSNMLVTHSEVVESRAFLAGKHRYALQCSFVSLVKEGTRKSGTYRTKLLFSLVETASGQIVLSLPVEGISTNVAAGPSTAFNGGVKNATEGLIRSSEFGQFLRP